MLISLVICSKDRAERLQQALARLLDLRLDGVSLELVVVDNASTDATVDVVRDFARVAPFDVRYCHESKPGLGAARNCGISQSRGDVLVFTDDDCYLAEDYFQVLISTACLDHCDYGGGQILAVHPDDDERVARLEFSEVRVIEPGSYFVAPGVIQGANIFFSRRVFEVAGLFREDMGAGTPFPCEDIEMVCRASNAGFRGMLLPGLRVLHDHGRRRDSPEAWRAIESYDYGRGAYYASLLCEGRLDVLKLWHQRYLALDGLNRDQLLKLARELKAAADFLGAQQFEDDVWLEARRHSGA